jgi:hypothetical protein
MEVHVKQLWRSSSLSALGLALGLGAFVGCGQTTGADDASGASEAQKAAVLKACHLDDGSVDHDADVRACDPQDDKKTTICHLPPGNPANAHTLCIGNAAVAAHLKNHHDYLGACKTETPCPPPSATPDAGPVCTPDKSDETDDQRAVAACHMDDGSVEKDAKVHACDPQDDKKTTICHLPPGNPANAHTLCIGNPAVAAHLQNHHDYLGPCKNETPCPPPGDKGGHTCPPPGGTPGTGGVPGGEGTGGVPGGEGTGGVSGTGGVGGTGGLIL